MMWRAGSTMPFIDGLQDGCSAPQKMQMIMTSYDITIRFCTMRCEFWWIIFAKQATSFLKTTI